ncbi:MAG: sodium/glutamate symporter [Microvirgula sp.]
MPWKLDDVTTLLMAVLILLLGAAINRRVGVLARCNIPEPVTGGIVFVALASLFVFASGRSIVLDPSARGPLLLAFFSTVGLDSDWALLRRSGPRLLLFLSLIVPYVLLQNLIGLGLAWAFDLHPAMGLLTGSITLIGGYGSGEAYAQRFLDQFNLQGAGEVAMTMATFGLLVGGLTGGPVARWLMKRHRLPCAGPAADGHERPDGARVLVTLALVLVCVVGGSALAQWFAGRVFEVPAFVWCLLIGVLLRNTGPRAHLFRVHGPTLEMLSALFLSLFLALSMLSLQRWAQLGLTLPLLLMVAVQTGVATLYAIWVCFRCLGRQYDAAVLSAGFCGCMVGSTATAVAGIQAITRHYGPSPLAFLIVPLVGEFCVSLVNALVLTGFLSLPAFRMP